MLAYLEASMEGTCRTAGVGDGDWSPASTPRNWRGEAKRMKMLEVGRERWEECWKRTVEFGEPGLECLVHSGGSWR